MVTSIHPQQSLAQLWGLPPSTALSNTCIPQPPLTTCPPIPQSSAFTCWLPCQILVPEVAPGQLSRNVIPGRRLPSLFL